MSIECDNDDWAFALRGWENQLKTAVLLVSFPNFTPVTHEYNNGNFHMLEKKHEWLLQTFSTPLPDDPQIVTMTNTSCSPLYMSNRKTCLISWCNLTHLQPWLLALHIIELEVTLHWMDQVFEWYNRSNNCIKLCQFFLSYTCSVKLNCNLANFNNS
jgi:hypothetical protein